LSSPCETKSVHLDGFREKVQNQHVVPKVPCWEKEQRGREKGTNTKKVIEVLEKVPSGVGGKKEKTKLERPATFGERVGKGAQDEKGCCGENLSQKSHSTRPLLERLQ